VRETEKRSSGGSAAHYDVHQSAAGYGNYQQWLAERNWSSAFRWRIIRFRTRPAVRAGWYTGAGAEQIAQFEAAGVDLVLLQFSPQFEEMERFAATVIQRHTTASAPA